MGPLGGLGWVVGMEVARRLGRPPAWDRYTVPVGGQGRRGTGRRRPQGTCGRVADPNHIVYDQGG